VALARIIRGSRRGDIAMRRGVVFARGNESLRGRIGQRALDDWFERSVSTRPIVAGFATAGATMELPYWGPPP